MKYSLIELQHKAVRAWAEAGMICVEMSDHRQIRFPAGANRHLSRATPEQLNNIELICQGTGLHWPDLDEDLSVIGVLEGRFDRQ